MTTRSVKQHLLDVNLHMDASSRCAIWFVQSLNSRLAFCKATVQLCQHRFSRICKKDTKICIYLSLPARRVITRCCFLSRVPSLYSHPALPPLLSIDDSDFHAVYCAGVTSMTTYDSSASINSQEGGLAGLTEGWHSWMNISMGERIDK